MGTLIELAWALETFAGVDPQEGITIAIQDVLSDLEAALAPSIWGVGLTVFGVLLFAAHLNFTCAALRSRLERMTLNTWIPALYPTTPQRTVETLEEAERQLQENVEAARDVAEFAEQVDDELEEFDEKIHRANDVLEGFANVMERADSASERFSAAMDGISETHEKVGALMEKADERADRLQSMIGLLSEENKELEERLRQLKKIEDDRREREQEMREKLSSTMEAAEKAYDSLSARNEDVLTELKTPLIQELENVRGQFEAVEETMHDRLGELKRSLDRLENPVESSTKKIERIADTFSEEVERLVRDVQDEFKRQNDALSGRQEEFSRLNDNLGHLVSNQNDLIEAVDSLNGRPRKRSFARRMWQRMKRLLEKMGLL